jgi:hypothetical protein
MSRGIVIDRAQADAVEFASKEVGRGAIESVRVTPEYVEATNSHILVRVPSCGLPVEEYPEVAGAGTEELTEALIKADTLRKAIKALPKRGHLPVLECLHIGRQNGNFTVTATDLESPTVLSQKAEESRFPDTEAVIPMADLPVTIGFSADLLGSICKWATRHGDGGRNPIAFQIRSPEDGARLTVNMRDGRTAVFVIMPVRV